MNCKMCTLKITDDEGCEFFQTVILNGNEFRRLIAKGADLIEIID